MFVTLLGVSFSLLLFINLLGTETFHAEKMAHIGGDREPRGSFRQHRLAEFLCAWKKKMIRFVKVEPHKLSGVDGPDPKFAGEYLRKNLVKLPESTSDHAARIRHCVSTQVSIRDSKIEFGFAEDAIRQVVREFAEPVGVSFGKLLIHYDEQDTTGDSGVKLFQG